MKFTTKLLGTAAAAALAALIASPASAANGTVSGSYANLDAFGSSGSLWNINGSLEGMVSDDWGLEGDAGYHSLSNGGGDIWNFGGNVFWRGDDTRINANVTYEDLDSGGFFGGGNETSYGLGAEFYASDAFTLAVKGGGLSGSGSSGGYVGGNVSWYIMPDLSLSGGVDYLDAGGSITSENIQAEWLVSESTPISIYGGYQHANLGSSVDTNTWFIGVKLYVNDSSDGTLVARQRTGSLGYTAQSPIFLSQY